MNLVQRKRRPLTRDSVSLRDDRLFIVACDDTYAPRQYFDFFRITRVQIHVVPTTDGTSSAAHVLGRLLQFDHEEDDELWMLLDTDHYAAGTHLKSFVSALGDAQRKGVNVALSKPSFELWLLLHHVEETATTALTRAADIERALREKLGQYNKTRLRKADYPLSSVPEACERAERLDKSITGGDIPGGNTTRVYLLWRAIAAGALPSQIPPELRDLIP